MAKCLEALVKNLGNNILFFKDNDKLLTLLAIYLGDANQDVRNVAKRGFQALSAEVMSANDMERLLQRVLSEQHYIKVKDFLEKEPFC